MTQRHSLLTGKAQSTVHTQGLPCNLEIAMAKAWVSDAYRRVTALAHQLHGSFGFTVDCDIELYYRRAKAAELYFGDADFQRDQIAIEIGLSK